jgi:hypothetical protein
MNGKTFAIRIETRREPRSEVDERIENIDRCLLRTLH